MRTHKLGARLLRVVTPDGKVRYFKSAPGFASLRLFWIFRNFASLNDSVLSLGQRALIRQIYRNGEVPKATVDPTKVLGTLAVSSRSGAHEWAAPARVIQLAIVPPPNVDRHSPGKLWRLALNSAGVAGVFLFIVGLLGNRGSRQQPTTYASSPVITASSQPQPAQTPKIRQVSSAKSAVADEPPQVAALQFSSNVPDNASKVAEQPGSTSEPAKSDDTDGNPNSDLTADLQSASSVSASSSDSVSKPIQSSVSSTLSAIPPADELPSSGPPQTHPVLADFSPVSQDTEVILRAIVSADGSVTKVKVLAGNSQVAREAARAVASWRYTPRFSRGDAESLIAFRFLAPDTVSVSFLDSAALDAHR